MTWVDWLLLIILWGASISRVRPALHALKHRTSLEQVMLWGAFTGMALSRVVTAPPVVAWMDATTGTELATLLRHLTGLASATSLLAYVEVITRNGRPSRARWIWPIAAVVMAVLTAMFIARGGRIYWVDGAHAPFPTASSGRVYLAVFDSWLMTCLASAGWMFGGYARVAPPLLRLGLVLSTIGMVAGVINRLHVMTINLVTLFDPDTTLREIPILGRVTLVICLFGITAGTSIPAWRAGVARWREFTALRELRPLWKALIDQYPDVKLKMDVPLQTRVVRRVLEIQDGMLNLTSVITPPESNDPRVAAEWVADALKDARAGAPFNAPAGQIPGPGPDENDSDTGASPGTETLDAMKRRFERETTWLRQVATQYKQQRARRGRSVARLGS
ncbi:hypothetical protein ETD86_37290 [Nonomuraea turkmeniaca]|uniref:DUF6545 domain-containing protein n=1 Tax=Nonomuraea turkmeniaca TaxID=103838 RepID=A0A5S4F4X4_9ACTN|nr:MAB_1171c family putative transporter [Nonomuraea turkmeniaca]TMR10974.1 hypothetical protein ETD86_37290 [Nonomuraea turkmeniaca]